MICEACHHKFDAEPQGRHRVLCGDARDSADVARVVGGGAVSVAFTSPPYASQRSYDESSGFIPIAPDAYVDWFEAVAANVAGVLAADGSWFVNIRADASAGQRSLYVHDLVAAHVRQWGWTFLDDFCWVDTRNGVPGFWPNRFKDAWEPVFHFARSASIKFRPLANGAESNAVFDYSPATSSASTGSGLLGQDKGAGMRAGVAWPSNVILMATATTGGHSAPFPVALPAWFIRAFSDPDDLVFDPFVGSGSTLIAAHNEGRRCAAIEISPAYVDVIVARFEAHTGLRCYRVPA